MKNKKTLILSAVAIATLFILIVGATFAYFKASGGTGSSANLNVTTYTSDLLTFEIGKDISIYADATTFAEGKGNASGDTYAKTQLTPNNKTNEATKYYYLYLKIENNNFEYTINNDTPELLLTVTDASGNQVTEINGLTYKTVTDGKGASISGFDITTSSDIITIFNNKEIKATNKTEEQRYDIKVIFVNYNEDQSKNMEKGFQAKLLLQKEKEGQNISLSDYVISQYTGTQGANGIYYHNASLANGAGDNSYRYAGANPNNFVCFGSDASTCPDDNLYRIIGVIDGKVKLIKYDYANSNLLGADGDYYNSATPDASYYKGELTSINTYYWNYINDTSLTYGSNIWSTSLLNKTNLNTNFINNIGESWANKIETTAWKVGGNTSANIIDAVPSVAYKNEITTPSESTTYNAKIGLMYTSDYGFAASSSAWTTYLRSYGSSLVTDPNWMYMGFYEWTISRDSAYSDILFYVNSGGNVLLSDAGLDLAVRPSFNLTSSTSYVSGSGSMTDPIRIN